MSNKHCLIRICVAGPCRMNLADDLFKQAEKLTADHANLRVERRGCMSACEQAPNLEIVDLEKNEAIAVHHEVKPSQLPQIIQNLTGD